MFCFFAIKPGLAGIALTTSWKISFLGLCVELVLATAQRHSHLHWRICVDLTKVLPTLKTRCGATATTGYCNVHDLILCFCIFWLHCKIKRADHKTKSREYQNATKHGSPLPHLTHLIYVTKESWYLEWSWSISARIEFKCHVTKLTLNPVGSKDVRMHSRHFEHRNYHRSPAVWWSQPYRINRWSGIVRF